MLEELFTIVGCRYLSDLKFADRSAKLRVAHKIETQYPAEAVSLWEWNDALDYLTGNTPESTSQAARDKLLQLLQGAA